MLRSFEMKKFPIVRFSPGNRLLSRAQFHVRLLLFWIYPILWAGMLFALSFLWKASLYAKAIPLVVLVVATPTDLFMSYDEYKALWEASNEPEQGG